MLAVRVDDKRLFALTGKPDAEACGGHALSATAFSVCDDYNFAHIVPFLPVWIQSSFLAFMKHELLFGQNHTPFLFGN